MTHLPISHIKMRGIRTLFFTQIFSTLSFSVLYSTLVLYITTGLKMSPSVALATTGSFVAFNFFLHLLGGYIGGRFLSYRFLFCIGMIFQILGCAILSLTSTSSLYWGLATFLTGCGLNVTCVNCMLTELFEPHDKNRETAFLWNYSGMNIGFLIGFSMSGVFQLSKLYSPLFLIAAVGNLIALAIILINWKVLKDKKTSLSTASSKRVSSLRMVGITLIIGLSLCLHWLLKHSTFSNELILTAGILMVIAIGCIAFQQRVEQNGKKIKAFLILLLSSLIFWTLYQMAPMGLTLFINYNVDRNVLGFIVPPQWLLNINTLIIIVGGPTMAHLYKKLRQRGHVIRIPVQFSLALLLIGLAFVILPLGIHFADAKGMTSFYWILGSYILQSLGELFISPIGYAMIGQLVPEKLQGLMMGTWLMNVGVSATLANYFSQIHLNKGQFQSTFESNPLFAETFNLLGWSAILGGLILFSLTPFLKKLIQERSPHISPHPYNSPEDTPN